MRSIFIVLGAICFQASMAQDVKINANSSASDLLSATNTSTASTDKVALRGISKPAPNWGIGVQGEGSYIGVNGFATTTGAGQRMGGYFTASGGSESNYGIAASGSTYAGYFLGNVYISGTLSNSSDLGLKKNVREIDAPLQNLMKMKPKAYEMKASEEAGLNLPGGKKYGLIAQDLELIYPELVSTFKQGEIGKSAAAPKSYKSIDYIGLIPILVGSLQEQQAQIEELKKTVQALKK